MFLSGIFGYKLIIDKGVNLTPILKKKGLQLILPALVFGAVGCLIHKENYITSFLLGGGKQYWFLFTLFEIMIIVSLSSLIKGTWRQCCLLFVIFVIFNLLPDKSLAAKLLSKDHFVFTYPFFLLGYFIYRVEELRYEEPTSLMCIIGSIVFFVLMLLRINFHPIIYLEALSGICLSFFAVKLANASSLIKKTLSYIGRYTLSIYLLHYFLWGMVPDNFLLLWPSQSLTAYIQQGFILLAVSALIIYVCILLTEVLARNRYTSMLVGR
jgi:fucose 4-O-acetylase-like acetyltransferase